MFDFDSVILDRLSPRRDAAEPSRDVSPDGPRERTFLGASPAGARISGRGDDEVRPALAGPLPDGLPDFRGGRAPRPWNAPPRQPAAPDDVLDSPESLGELVERSVWVRPHPRNRHRGRA